jgi:hypothetical protein
MFLTDDKFIQLCFNNMRRRDILPVKFLMYMLFFFVFFFFSLCALGISVGIPERLRISVNPHHLKIGLSGLLMVSKVFCIQSAQIHI